MGALSAAESQAAGHIFALGEESERPVHVHVHATESESEGGTWRWRWTNLSANVVFCCGVFVCSLQTCWSALVCGSVCVSTSHICVCGGEEKCVGS